MNTKERRLEHRKLWTSGLNSYPVPVHLNIEIWTKDDPERKTYSLKAFSGSRGKPDINLYYRTAEQRKERIDSYIAGHQRLYDWEQEKAKEAGTERYQSTAARCAKAIRAELKAVYPGIKFRVVSDNFANGNSVDVSWIDGPSSEEVRKIADKYQYGHFDGMTDMYEYSNMREDIPQAKFVSCGSTMSEERKEALKAEISNKYDVDMNDERACFEKFGRWPGVVIHQALNGSL